MRTENSISGYTAIPTGNTDPGKALSGRGPGITPASADVCLTMGAICVLSSVAKTWLGTPGTLDWILLGTGAMLCALPQFGVNPTILPPAAKHS